MTLHFKTVHIEAHQSTNDLGGMCEEERRVGETAPSVIVECGQRNNEDLEALENLENPRLDLSTAGTVGASRGPVQGSVREVNKCPGAQTPTRQYVTELGPQDTRSLL